MRIYQEDRVIFQNVTFYVKNVSALLVAVSVPIAG